MHLVDTLISPQLLHKYIPNVGTYNASMGKKVVVRSLLAVLSQIGFRNFACHDENFVTYTSLIHTHWHSISRYLEQQ